MLTGADSDGQEGSDLSNGRVFRPPTLWVLIAIVAAEATLVGVGTVYSIVSLPTAPAAETSTALALIVVAAVITLGLVGVVLGLWRRRGWARSGALTWQVLQGALAIGCFQGLFAAPELGWALLLPALVGFVLCLTPSVVRATRRG